MARTKTFEVESSVIKSFYATNEGQGLVVELVSGDVYSYPSATKKIVEDFIKAESKGKFFVKYIKPLPFKKL